MDKIVEEKAMELAFEYAPSLEDSPRTIVIDNACMKMAEWMKQQMIEKAVKWLKENAGMYWYDDIYIDCPDELLENFKKAMEE